MIIIIKLVLDVLVVGIFILMMLDRLPMKFQSYKIIRGFGHIATDAKKLFLLLSFSLI